MQILNFNQKQLSFSSINLNDKEIEKSNQIIGKIKSNPEKSNKLKSDLFNDVFQSHIQKEAKLKSGTIYYSDDVFQDLCILFFEKINDVENLTTQKLIDIINKFKPSAQNVVEQYRRGTSSLNETFSSGDNRSLNDLITDENLPVYASKSAPEEIKNAQKDLQDLINSANLTSVEQQVLEKRKQNETYKSIANKLGVSAPTARFKGLSAIAKIQNIEGTSPQTIIDEIDDLSAYYKLNEQEKNKLQSAYIKNPGFFYKEANELKQNISELSSNFEVQEKDIVKSALRQPSLFYQKPETIMKNIEILSNKLDADRQVIIKSALRQPTLFYQKPDTLIGNIETLSKKLGVERQVMIKNAISHPQLFYQKPDTLMDNIETLSKKLGVERQVMIKTAISHPQLFSQKPDTLIGNIETLSNKLGVDKQVTIKSALKRPQLFYQKPETIMENIEILSNKLGVERQVISKSALRQPPLFCLKPETAIDNIETLSEKLGLSKNVVVKSALVQPNLFYQKYNTLIENIETLSNKLGVDRQAIIKLAIARPTLFVLKPDTSIKKIKILEFYRLVQKKTPQLQFSTHSDQALYQDVLSVLIKFNDKLSKRVPNKELVSYLSQMNKIYEFNLPEHLIKEDFIKFAKEFSQKNFNKQMFKFL